MMETACSQLPHPTLAAQKEKGLLFFLPYNLLQLIFEWRLVVAIPSFFSHKKNTKKHRMKVLLASVTESREAGTGRRLCDLFMVKPSKKDYPDYYKVILEPMDLRTIEHNIRSDKYMTEDSMVEDMKLMFRNARHYNEEGSQVWSALFVPWCFSNVLILAFLRYARVNLWSMTFESIETLTVREFSAEKLFTGTASCEPLCCV